jgi:hypothetical protein
LRAAVGIALANLGSLLSREGELERARDTLEHAENILSRHLAADSPALQSTVAALRSLL